MRNAFAGFALTLGLLTTSSWAAPILGVTASTTTFTNGGDILNTANGFGLAPGQVAGATHAQSDPSNAWATLDAPATVNLTFDLNGIFSLVGMSIWNANGSSAANGIQGVSVLSSTDGLLFNSIAGAPAVFAMGGTAPSPADGTFTWAPVVATHVRFLVASNHGGSAVNFNEVLFDALFDATSAGVPEIAPNGSLFPLITVCLTLLCSTRRRLRTTEAS